MKTGIIKGIQPDGGYSSQNGYIYQYQMTIEFEGEGQQTGEIGSKSDPYPMNVGEEINVEIKKDARARTGNKYKKVNPQYSQGGSQGQQGAPQQPNGVARSNIQPNSKDEMICRQTAGKVAGEVVAAMIMVAGGSPQYPVDVNGKLLEISDMMSMWFIEGTKQKKPGEDELGF